MAELTLGGTLVDGLGERLFEATEGNPLFVQELVGSLAESDALGADGSGRFSLAGDTALASRSLPETVQQVVEGRLDRLPDGEREVLTLAAVLGQGLDYDDLEDFWSHEEARRPGSVIGPLRAPRGGAYG